jgi:prevent-host-death family protein
MSIISLKDAKAGFSAIVDKASGGEFVTITRHGKPAAVLVSVDAAEAAQKAVRWNRKSLTDHLLAFPQLGDDILARNSAPSRDVDL